MQSLSLSQGLPGQGFSSQSTAGSLLLQDMDQAACTHPGDRWAHTREAGASGPEHSQLGQPAGRDKGESAGVSQAYHFLSRQQPRQASRDQTMLNCSQKKKLRTTERRGRRPLETVTLLT